MRARPRRVSIRSLRSFRQLRARTELTGGMPEQVIASLYPGCEIAEWGGTLKLPDVLKGEIGIPDPRSDEDKKKVMENKRRVSYPDIRDQLDMMYWDKVNGTATWVDAITAIKKRYQDA